MIAVDTVGGPVAGTIIFVTTKWDVDEFTPAAKHVAEAGTDPGMQDTDWNTTSDTWLCPHVVAAAADIELERHEAGPTARSTDNTTAARERVLNEWRFLGRDARQP